MATFEHALLLLLLVTALSVAASRLPWPEPITYVLGGIGFAFVPAFPRVAFDPGFFFVCFLPPLLFSDGWLMPLREFMRERRSILVYATGLVAFTTIGVGLIAYWLIPGLPLALAFALGAIISPTDAVAVNAITDKLKVPTRLRIVLNGESLMNDATGLVGFKFALAALIAGSFSLRALALEFVLIAVGGLVAGLVVGYVVGKVRDFIVRAHRAEPLVETTLSLLTPYAAYFAAHAFHVSDILAVVAAGLYSGWRDPVKMDAATRQTAWTVWSTVLFWLNGLAFVLLGLQFPGRVASVSGAYSTAQLLGFTAAIAGIAMLLRLAWFLPSTYALGFLARAIAKSAPAPSWREALVGGWAGMRGAVTFAAALSIPLTLPDGAPLPGRDIVIFLAFGVVLVTLVVQGTSLSWLIRRLGLGEDGVRQREELVARTAAVSAGLKVLRGLETKCTAAEENAALGHVVAEYEQRLSELVAEGETRTNAARRRAAEKDFRFTALKAERAALDDLWRQNEIADEVYRPLQHLLDYEEAMLNATPTGVES